MTCNGKLKEKQPRIQEGKIICSYFLHTLFAKNQKKHVKIAREKKQEKAKVIFHQYL